MQNSYADNATFNDPAFGDLNALQVRSMWEMLIGSSLDMVITFDKIKADDKTGTAEWMASYTFSGTGNKVVNKVKASFIFENGKIIRHHDHFNFHTWSRQALGLSGLLLGWTRFLKNKVRKTATGKLQKYMAAH